MLPDAENEPTPREHLRRSLQRIILLRETGPKSAAWHRARTKAMWRLHRQIDELAAEVRPNDEQSIPRPTA